MTVEAMGEEDTVERLFGTEVDEEYLYHLGSIGWEGVKNEKSRVAEDRESLLEQSMELAYDNYKTFIEASERSEDVDKRLSSCRDRLEDISSTIVAVTEACSSFQKRAEELSEKRKATSLVLDKHTRLLEILELPQLSETCVRNGNYEEALELQRYAQKLDKKIGSIPVVTGVIKSVQNSSQLMLNQLLSQLRNSIQLPACLRVFGYLRRMDIYSESELRVRFLQARETWLSGVLSSIPRSDNSYEYLSGVVEATRVHLFEIVTQYRAIFTDDDPIIVSSSNFPIANRQIFSSWIQRRISIFIEVIREELSKSSKHQQSSLDALLGQSMYFGQSMGRVGADFRILLIPIFTKAVRQAALQHLSGAEQRFKQGMEKIALKNSFLVPSNSNIEDLYQPPMSIIEFLPLAEVTNCMLSCLNETRLCAPLCLAHDIKENFERLINSCSKVLISYPTNRFSDTEWNAYRRLISVYCRDFIPFIVQCFSQVFPKDQIAKSIGISLNDVKELKTDLLIEPLKHLLPQEIVNEVITVKPESVETTECIVDKIEVVEQVSKEETSIETQQD